MEEKFAAQLAAQQNLVKTFRFLSPSIVAQEAANDIAGTGLDRYQNFRSQVKEFNRTWADYFVPRIYRMEKLSAAEFDRIPRFEFQEESIGSVFNRVIFSILFLLIAAAALMFLTFGKLKDYGLEK